VTDQTGDSTEWIARLERQLDRERRARRESEQIAERGMRELWLANRSLDERVEERTIALQASLGAAQSAARAKESFLAHLGNELGTPLHAALGNLELLDTTALAEDDRARVATMHRALHQLSGLLEGLMTLAASEGVPTGVVLEGLTPGEFLDDLTRRWQRRLAERGQLMVAELAGEMGSLVADWRRLGRVADALLDNVIQHAHPGRAIVALKVADGMVVLEVSDTGPGIPVEMWGLVTTPFFRLDADPGSAKAGAGVGLAVAQRLMEGVGGSLQVSATENGTTVVVTLPSDTPPHH
jgi:signal transduction histidine kinase